MSRPHAFRAAHRNAVYLPGPGDFEPPADNGQFFCFDCMGEGVVTVLVHEDRECDPVEEKQTCPYCGGAGHICE
jgi:DnaJ-class molecular chaperone